MLVVADTSPLVVLIVIGHVDVLPALFREVIIPPQIAIELAQFTRQQSVQDFVASKPAWLVEMTPAGSVKIPRLHVGESAAITLATEINADLVLIDEARGRREVQRRGIRMTGTLGVLELAADAELLDLAEAFDRIKLTDFWMTNDLMDDALKRYRARKGKKT